MIGGEGVRFDHHHYIPCLRWKMGEYQAILKLCDESKDALTPLIEVPEIGFDFEEQKPKKSIDGHLAPFGRRVDQKWHNRPFFVDLKLICSGLRMGDGSHPVSFVLDDLRGKGCLAVPVFGFDRDSEYQKAVQDAAAIDGRGICIRVSVEEAARGIDKKVNSLLEKTSMVMGDLDLILDLGAPNFVPVEGFSRVVKAIIGRIPKLNRWRTFSIIGTSFPASMGEIKKSPEILQRNEWLLYQRLIDSLVVEGLRLPTFGDYGINHPDVLDLDMRFIKPSASIRYTIDDAWLFIKGPNVRDHGFAQYRDHCHNLVSSPEFMGPNFSFGDRYIAQCAAGTSGTGNLTTWRQIGTNHHLQKVVADVASLNAF